MTRKTRLEKIIAPPKLRSASHIRILTERPPATQAPGKARRFAHIENELVRRRITLTTDSVLGDVPPDAGLLRRSAGVALAVSRYVRTTRRGETIILIGLGEVHMLVLAMILSLLGRDVTFDACDSWRLQIDARWRSGRRMRAAIPVFGAMAQSLAPRRMAVSYISERDRQADRRLCRRLDSFVIVPSAPAELLTLPRPSSGRVSRLVVVADLSSSHNSGGLQSLLAAWERVYPLYPDLRLELFGVGLPEFAPPGAVVRGWAPSISDIYSGDTGVFVTNVLQSGVPNKLVEAIAAQRPVLMHVSLRRLVNPHPWVIEWEGDLEAGLRQLLDLSLVPTPSEEMSLR